ncbi:MAG TPA: MAPEG family protein [Kiloniellales bacterium]|nr:MAPEG family protein [Kiloniellales bacterium]
MSTDLSMLAWTALITILMWIPYILVHIRNVGVIPALTYQADDNPLPPWAARAKKAHHNAIENLAPFAALVLVADVTGAANAATAAAAIAYFLARLAHYFLYMANVPFGRTTMFTIGWLAMVCIFWQILAV